MSLSPTVDGNPGKPRSATAPDNNPGGGYLSPVPSPLFPFSSPGTSILLPLRFGEPHQGPGQRHRRPPVGSVHVIHQKAAAVLYTNALIGLREGLEATRVVIILGAYLKKTGQRRSYPWLWGGIAAAPVVTVSVFLIIHFGT